MADPIKLMLRNTGLHDDLGGLGQAIWTTAGQGYKKIAFIEANPILAENAALREKLGKCEKDADRYRWLRSGSGGCDSVDLELSSSVFKSIEWPDESEIDAAIDAAIKEKL